MTKALDFDGSRFLVGFETHDRVAAYKDFHSPATLIDLPPEALAGIFRGAGFSSVAALPGGGMIALPEFTSDDPAVKAYVPGRTRGWLITPKGAGPIWLRQSDFRLPVSLSAFPNGDLLLLELFLNRRAPITITRLSRIRAKDLEIGGTMQAEDLAVLAPPVPGSRFESSSIRVGPKGETLIYLVSNAAPAALYLFEVEAAH